MEKTFNAPDAPRSALEAGAPRPLRVCHLAYTFFETDNRVLRYAKALVERGDQVDVVALRRAGQRRTGTDHGVRIIRVQRRTKTEGAPWTYLAKILWFFAQALVVLGVQQFKRRYDVIHVHNVPDFLVFAAVVPRLFGARIILDIHDIQPELYAGKFGTSGRALVFRGLLLVERMSCRFADHVVVANHIWHQRLLDRSVAPEKCTPILNYPDLRVFRPRDGARGFGRTGPFTILYPGSLNRYQGLDVAIEAFAMACDRMPRARFHIYGEGPARAGLAALVRQRGLESRVRLMDPLPVEDIAAVMASADLGVEPKLAMGFSNEAMSTKILEFMASGVPVIVSRTRVHTHYFDQSHVTFVDPGNAADLAAALVDAYDRPPDSAALAAAVDFAARYSWQQRMAEYYGLVNALTERAPSLRFV
jgi:glycosyltransferase involved in cell wall biosynthesis